MLTANPRIYVVDDFFDDPHAVRARAEKLEFTEPGYHIGKSSSNAGDEQTLDKLRQIIGAKFIWWPHMSGPFRLGVEGDGNEYGAHADQDDLERIFVGTTHTFFSAVIYLSLPEHSTGGLDFRRHKKTGRTQFDPRPAPEIPVEDFKNKEAWETWLSVPIKFNRAIVFPGWLFHHPSDPKGHGTDFKTGRLLQLYWFYEGFHPGVSR